MLKIAESMKTFKHLKGYPKGKRKDTYWHKYAGFIQECGQLFDIKYKTDERKKLQEKAWKVDMTKKDQTFYKKFHNRDTVPLLLTENGERLQKES